jgi:hypothetical protein
MDYKNPVSVTGDGVLLLDILMKYAVCLDYMNLQVTRKVTQTLWHKTKVNLHGKRNSHSGR